MEQEGVVVGVGQEGRLFLIKRLYLLLMGIIEAGQAAAVGGLAVVLRGGLEGMVSSSMDKKQ